MKKIITLVSTLLPLVSPLLIDHKKRHAQIGLQTDLIAYHIFRQ